MRCRIDVRVSYTLMGNLLGLENMALPVPPKMPPIIHPAVYTIDFDLVERHTKLDQ